MSHTIKKGRGRPRAFEEGAILASARDAFWSRGLAGVSLDQIATTTGVARPSLAAVFGDKRALYLSAIDDFMRELEKAAATLMSGRGELRAELTAFFRGAVDLYLSGTEPRGCMAICTLPVEAVHDDEIRTHLANILAATDTVFTNRFRLARAQGQLPAGQSVTTRGALAAALLHSVAIRARAGAPKASLHAMIKSALVVICGQQAAS